MKALFLAAALFFVLALGRHTPVHAWARWIVPGLALSRYPEKHVVVAGALLWARQEEGAA